MHWAGSRSISRAGPRGRSLAVPIMDGSRALPLADGKLYSAHRPPKVPDCGPPLKPHTTSGPVRPIATHVFSLLGRPLPPDEGDVAPEVSFSAIARRPMGWRAHRPARRDELRRGTRSYLSAISKCSISTPVMATKRDCVPHRRICCGGTSGRNVRHTGLCLSRHLPPSPHRDGTPLIRAEAKGGWDEPLCRSGTLAKLPANST